MIKQLSPCFAIFGFLMFGAFSAQAADKKDPWKAPLLESLKGHYQVTTRDFLGKVQKPGTVLVVMRDGIQADEPKAFMKPTVIETGAVAKSGGGSIVTGWGGRALKPGEKVLVYDVRVDDDAVLLMIGTVNTIDIIKNKKTKAVAQQAALSFRIKELPTATKENVLAAINPWLIPEAEATAAKSVSVGQTIVEVENSLGKPSKIANLEGKSIYYYSDMKVIFVDGKVKDIQ